MSSNVPWSEEFSEVLKFWVKPPASGFGASVMLASRLLQAYYSIEDKALRLMAKQLSTVRNTQRDSLSYIENRKGRKEIGVTWSRKRESQ